MTMINYTVVTIDFAAAKVRRYGKIEFEVTTGLRTNSIFLLQITGFLLHPSYIWKNLAADLLRGKKSCRTNT